MFIVSIIVHSNCPILHFYIKCLMYPPNC